MPSLLSPCNQSKTSATQGEQRKPPEPLVVTNHSPRASSSSHGLAEAEHHLQIIRDGKGVAMKLCVRAPWLSFSLYCRDYLFLQCPVSSPPLHSSLCSFVTFIFSSCRILYNLVLPNIPPNACVCACFRLCGYSRCPKLWTSIWEHSMCCRKLLYVNPSASTPVIPSISLTPFSDHHQPLLNIFSPPGSQHGWCDTDFAHCDPANCLKAFSGPGSSCASGKTTLKTTSSTSAYVSSIPNIDVCGSASGGVSCPGAGTNGYFYRCCSSHGHCGPKNDVLLPLSPIHPKKKFSLANITPPTQLQDQSLYCGPAAGCQPGFGDCATNRSPPPMPTAPAKPAQMGETCGPIVNAKCASGLCCSGSNFCGSGSDFCKSANWCQPKWGSCSA
jgi:hypothetical protein